MFKHGGLTTNKSMTNPSKNTRHISNSLMLPNMAPKHKNKLATFSQITIIHKFVFHDAAADAAVLPES
jgi:hypothetical protein